jgi:hypothetical protein
MSACAQVRVSCDETGCITSQTVDTGYRTVARLRLNERGWACDPRGILDRCPEHRLREKTQS